MVHPRDILLESKSQHGLIPVVDHYCGLEPRMSKALQLQSELIQEFGNCVMDVTLDCEDGAPVGAEAEHAALVLSLAQNARQKALAAGVQIHSRQMPRVAVRVHAIDHLAFEQDLAILLGQNTEVFCHLMIPKVEDLASLEKAITAINAAGGHNIPIHVLIESAYAVHNAFAIASHPRVQSISFGLMDFVSSHGGAIGSQAMSSAGQFQHPMVLRAKLEIAAACHAYGKVPSHCVVTEFANEALLLSAAQQAAHQLSYQRMWSIHPKQIKPILQAFAPQEQEIELACQVIGAAALANWGPVSVDSKLHDRASFRYFWQVIERAASVGHDLPASISKYFSASAELISS